MNEAAIIVAESLLGTYHKKVTLGRMTFNLYQPTVKDLCNILNCSNVSITDEVKRLELIATMPEHIEECACALSFAVTIKKPFLQRAVNWYITRYATMKQITAAFQVLAGVINGKEFFEKVKFDKTRSESTAVTVGANTLYGAVISLMESLHLSYSEAFEKIPYPQMLIMSADRLRALSPSEKVITQSSGKEMAARRRRRGK